MRRKLSNMRKQQIKTILIVIFVLVFLNLIITIFNGVITFFTNIYNNGFKTAKELVLDKNGVLNDINKKLEDLNNTISKVNGVKNDPVGTIIDTVNKESKETFATIGSGGYVADFKFDKTKIGNKKLYKVIAVADGDTVSVDIDGIKRTVRMIGVDTPETKDPRKPVQCFGKEASEFTKKTLKNKYVYLVEDPTQQSVDKYGRLLRYIVLEDMTFFNYELVNQGFANEYTYGIAYQYQIEFKEAQKHAKENNIGLWSPSTCNGDTKKAVE